MAHTSEIARREDVDRALAKLGDDVYEGFLRFIARPDVLGHLEEIARHYKTDAYRVATLAFPGFIATIMIDVMRCERAPGDEDMPTIAKMFLRGMRLHMSGVVDDVFASAAEPAKLAAALIERFRHQPDVLDRANIRVARAASPRDPAAS